MVQYLTVIFLSLFLDIDCFFDELEKREAISDSDYVDYACQQSLKKNPFIYDIFPDPW